MCYEVVERKIGRLEVEKSVLKEKFYEEIQKFDDVKFMMNEIMNGFGCF